LLLRGSEKYFKVKILYFFINTIFIEKSSLRGFQKHVFDLQNHYSKKMDGKNLDSEPPLRGRGSGLSVTMTLVFRRIVWMCHLLLLTALAARSVYGATLHTKYMELPCTPSHPA
jgi:hypothetical protein